MPRSAENRSTISNHAGEISMRPASTLARSSRSSTISANSAAVVADELHLLFLLLGQRAVDAVEQQPRDAADRRQRRAELVAHVGQEAALELGRLPQLLGLRVELGVERDHAAVGLLELGLQRLDESASPESAIERLSSWVRTGSFWLIALS